MNTHVIEALQTGYTTVKVIYDDQIFGSQKYTFKVPLSYNIQVDDLVLVEMARQKGAYRSVKVVEVDNNPDINFQASYNYKWIVSKIDLTQHKQLLVQESDLKVKLVESERLVRKNAVLTASGLPTSDIDALIIVGEVK